jgi:hypothetical protein
VAESVYSAVRTDDIKQITFRLLKVKDKQPCSDQINQLTCVALYLTVLTLQPLLLLNAQYCCHHKKVKLQIHYPKLCINSL